MKKKLVLIAICIPIIFVACKKNGTDTPGNGGGNGTIDCGTVKFSSTILPLISNKCATSGCHDATSSNGPGPLTNYAQIFASRTSIVAAVTSNRMPQGGPALSTQEKATLTCWINANAPNN
jgi:hypothetical protein